MRRAWLLPLLLLACAHAAPADPFLHGKRPVGANPYFECTCVVQQRHPAFLLDPIRLGPAPGSLPYTMDGRTSAYTLTHLR